MIKATKEVYNITDDLTNVLMVAANSKKFINNLLDFSYESQVNYNQNRRQSFVYLIFLFFPLQLGAFFEKYL